MTATRAASLDGPLELSVECRTQRGASSGLLHTIQIAADWSVTTPHDLEAERIAVAFGGYTSCVELVDAVIPALARSMGILTRQEPLSLGRSEDHTTWTAPRLRACTCSRAKFGSAQVAGAHQRSAEHLSRRFKVSRQLLGEVLESVKQAAPLTTLSGYGEAGAAAAVLVKEANGLRDLWAAGISPERVLDMAELAACVEDPLPVAYYLGIAYGSPDTDWLRRTLVARPDPAVAAWLAWIPSESALVTDDTADWLRLRLSSRQIELMTTEVVRPAAAHELAAQTQRTPHTAAQDLALWAAAGCHPTVADMQILDRHGLGSTYQPARSAVDRLVEHAQRIPAPPGRNELGVLLALEGTLHNVEAILARGVRSAAELVAEHQR